MGQFEEPCIYESAAHDDIIRKTSHTVGWTTKLRNNANEGRQLFNYVWCDLPRLRK